MFLSYLFYRILFKEIWAVTALPDSHTDTSQGENHEIALNPKCCTNLSREISHEVLILTLYITETYLTYVLPISILKKDS